MDISSIRLARPTIDVYAASGKRCGQWGLSDVRHAIAEGRVGRITRRGGTATGAIRRLDLLAGPGEIARRITAAPTVVRVLRTTWTHRESLRAERIYDARKVAMAESARQARA